MATMRPRRESSGRDRAGVPVGVVVAGGRSSRMGADKALLTLDGTTLAERAARCLAAVCPVVLVADRGRSTVAGLASVEDGPGGGPAAGLLGAARAAPDQPLLVLGCDLPAVPTALLAGLVELAGGSGADLALPRSPRGLEPLVGYYGPRALASLERQVADGRFALRHLLENPDLAVTLLEGEALAAFGDPERIFANLNTPEELEAFRRSTRPGA